MLNIEDEEIKKYVCMYVCMYVCTVVLNSRELYENVWLPKIYALLKHFIITARKTSIGTTLTN